MKRKSLILLLSFTSLTLWSNCKNEPAAIEEPQDLAKPEKIEYTPAEEALLKDAREMIDKKDVSSMLKRVHKDKEFGKSHKEVQKDYLVNITEKEISSIVLERVEPAEKENVEHDGTVRMWSLPLMCKLVFNEAQGSNNYHVGHVVDFSDDNGKLVIIRKIAK